MSILGRYRDIFATRIETRAQVYGAYNSDSEGVYLRGTPSVHSG